MHSASAKNVSRETHVLARDAKYKLLVKYSVD